jgi:transmembrane sensor
MNLLLELLDKYRNQTIIAEEMNTLQQLLHDPANKVALEEMLGEGFISAPHITNNDSLKREIFDSVQKSGTVVKMRPFKWIAAASIIILSVLTIYQWMIPPSHNNITIVKHDAAPGTDKATLQLADGTTIILDSTNNGQLKADGISTIMNNDGQLIYTSNKIQTTNLVLNSMRTPRGGQYKIVLEDGTKVWLNSASTIKYPAVFSANTRTIELDGEAYFEVAKNTAKPFIVKTAEMETTVLGTHFNINAYTNENRIQTTLIEGSVQVKADNTELLKPGQQGELNQGKIKVKKDIDIDEVIAWQKGLFKFRNADVNRIARQLSRWYDVDIKVDEKLSTLTLGGGISKRSQLSEVLELLKSNGAGNKWENGQLILYPL